MSKRCNFEVDNYRVVEENSNSQFSTLEIDVCRSGDNKHRMPISRGAIEASASSVKGKPVLAAFRFAGTEFGGHDEDEQAVGFFVEEEPELIEKDYQGKQELFIRARAKVWKRYFENAMNIFERKNGKTDVSMEIDMLDFQEPDNKNEGNINLFSILGCTLLGVNPSIQGSEARVMSFSEIKDAYAEETKNKTDIEKFADARRDKMAEMRYKINKTELKDTPWGDVDKTAMRNKIMKAINKAELVKAVYALVEDGWQDAPSQHLKYPIMQLVGDTFYYNRYGLASALAYAKQEGEQAVISKVEKLYKKFKIEDEGGEKGEMADINEKDTKLKAEEPDTEMSENTEDMQEQENLSDDADAQADMSEDDKEIDKADRNLEPDDDDAKGSDEDAEDFSDDSAEEDMCDAKMSLDVNAYAGAMLEMLKAETDEEREEAKKLGMSDDDKMNIIMEECFGIACELAELRKFKCDKMAEETSFAVAQILSEVRADMSQDKYAELEAESKNCKFDEIEQFRMKAQAFAYRYGVKRDATKKESHIRMGFDTTTKNDDNRSVFAKILNK